MIPYLTPNITSPLSSPNCTLNMSMKSLPYQTIHAHNQTPQSRTRNMSCEYYLTILYYLAIHRNTALHKTVNMNIISIPYHTLQHFAILHFTGQNEIEYEARETSLALSNHRLTSNPFHLIEFLSLLIFPLPLHLTNSTNHSSNKHRKFQQFEPGSYH